MPTCRIQCLGRTIHGDSEVDDTNDRLPNISNDHVQDNLEGFVYSGILGFWEPYLKLKRIFEGTCWES